MSPAGSRHGMGEASDDDSGIMLLSGPASPVPPPKERVQAGRRQQQALEARLEGCVQELRRLCLREAELTGTLPREYPLKAGEKPPKVRRRIGAAFKLDEIVVLHGVDPLERERALQLRIAEASRRLCHEQNIGRRLRKRRQTAALREEQKLRDLEQVLSQRRLLTRHRDTGTAHELSGSEESSLSDTGLLEEEDTRPPGPATPRMSPSPKDATEEEEEGSGPPPSSPSPWRETSLDRPYERGRNPGINTGNGETRSSRCYLGSPLGSPPATPGSPDPVAPLGARPGDPPYRFVPMRTLVLCRQGGSSAPGTPETPARRGQSQARRMDPCPSPRVDPSPFPRMDPCPLHRLDPPWPPLEPRGRPPGPRRRPPHCTVSFPPPAGPSFLSGSAESVSSVSSASRAPSPGGSGPDGSLAASLPLPGPRPRDPPRVQPPPSGLLLEQDLAPLRYQRLVPSRSRIVRTPSLKDCGGARGLSRAAVTEELRSWHQRARLRGARPHSLDREGALGRPPGGTPGDGPLARAVLSRVQVPPMLRRSVPGVPVQLYVPENGEIVTQV
ncbi:innate immunity activator protein isoform X1 [Pipra filicauda]|uniref:Innate immunity activator protein isoform X1 n=2 Tax=Pipra filicauda TaxID=649802 RepID=A0A6J2FVR6_9PASS|nr:innate immunity activator protein isoform X1 [Pipra filicauda]